jgi:mannosyltransferase OCH1-like enzyme
MPKLFRQVRGLFCHSMTDLRPSNWNLLPYRYRRAFSVVVLFMAISSILWSIDLSQHAPYRSSGARKRESTLEEQLSSFFPYDISADLPKLIWQTWKTSPVEGGSDTEFRSAEASRDTSNPDFEHEVITDDHAVKLVHRLFAGIPAVF